MVNIQCLHVHKAELQYHLGHVHFHLVLIQEMWRDASHESPAELQYHFDYVHSHLVLIQEL